VVATLLKRSRLLAALAFTACLSPVDPGAGDVGELRVRARYASGAAPEALGVTVDSAAVVADSSAGGAAPAVDAVVGLPAPDSSVAWLVDVAGDTTLYHVRLTLSGGGVTLYRGEADVAVGRGGFESGAVHEVPVAYVGPGAVADITVTPGSATLVTRGATQPFQAVARDADGDVVDAPFTWTSDDAAVAAVDGASGVATAVATGATIITASARGVSGTARLTVAEGGLFVEVTPASVTLPAIGATRQFSATARDASGTPVAGAEFAWSAAGPAVVSVDAAGVATAMAEGTGQVIAATGGVADTADVGVAVVTVVEVTPANATLEAVGATRQFTAIARRENGDPVDGVEFAWASADPAVATVDPATGLATAVADGEVAITAQAGAASGDATLTVARTVASVAVTPGDVTLTAAGATQAFTAVARDANGHPIPDASFAWTSSNPAAAAVDPATGVATASTTGRAEIAASTGGVSGMAVLTVAIGGLVVSVTPDAATLTALGAERRLTATASDAGGTPIPDAVFVWITRAPGVAAVDGSGLVTATGEGGTWVVAGSGGQADSAAITVAVAVAVEVSPATAALAALGQTRQFTAVVRDGAGNPIPGAAVEWSSDAPVVATVDPETGLATALGNGVATIRAASGSASGAATLTVAQAVAAIEVTPAAVTLEALDATAALTAVARDAYGHAVIRPVTFAWSSDRPDVVAVDPATGLATAVAGGAAVVSASAEGVRGDATVTVDQRVTTVDVTPAAATLTAFGGTQAFAARGRDANGHVVPDAAFEWTVSDPAVATVAAGTGLVTAVGNGETGVTATADGIGGTALVTVRQAVAAIAVTPATVGFTALGQTVQLVAVARDPNGHDVTRPVSLAWSSDRPDVAGVDPGTGLATANASGAATITASAEGVTAGVPVTVDQAVTTVEVTPVFWLLKSLGETFTFTATARDANGNVIPGVTVVWSSENEAVATVDPSTGQVVAVAHGETTISATAGGVTGGAFLKVRQAVASIEVTPVDATLTTLGATQQYTAVARDALGNAVASATIGWEISDAAVGTIDPVTGLATAVGIGTATVTARAGDVSGTALLRVVVEP
jgi:uncharacterized protein YjdB